MVQNSDAPSASLWTYKKNYTCYYSSTAFESKVKWYTQYGLKRTVNFRQYLVFVMKAWNLPSVVRYFFVKKSRVIVKSWGNYWFMYQILHIWRGSYKKVITQWTAKVPQIGQKRGQFQRKGPPSIYIQSAVLKAYTVLPTASHGQKHSPQSISYPFSQVCKLEKSRGGWDSAPGGGGG